MKALDLCKELSNKQRTVRDLIRFIRTRTDSNPNYSLLLGAGCSITSGIRSASELTSIWREEVFYDFEENEDLNYDENAAIDFLSRKGGGWYNREKEYSSLFEKKYDLPRQRRMFVETEVANKFPSLGYAYLTQLVKEGYFNTIFTTNFDDLINEAFYQFSTRRPIVCAHDSGIGSITVTSKRPKIIKLHGDYLFDDIKSTLRETESLEENIKNKFVEFAKDFGLMVIGYGGGDRSVMDVLSYLLKHDDYYKGGIYWCLRGDAEIGEDLRKLLWKERAYFVIIDGFDELLAEINHKIIGEELPVDTSFITDKADTVINSFVDNKLLKQSISKYIQEDLNKLSSQQKNDTIFSLIKEATIGDDTKNLSNNYSNDELMLMLGIEDMVKKQMFSDAIKAASDAISTANKKMRVELNRIIAEINEENGEPEKAVRICDELIKLQPNNPAHYIRKSRVVEKIDNKLNVLDKAIEVDNYYYYPYMAKALVIADMLTHYYGSNKDALINDMFNLFDLGIKRYPGINNRCWKHKFNNIKKYEKNSDARKRKENEIIETISEQDKNSPVVLELRYLQIDKDDNQEHAIATLLNDISEAKNNSLTDQTYIEYEILEGKVLKEFNKVDQLKKYFDTNDNDERINEDKDYLELKARASLGVFDDIDTAISVIGNLVIMKKATRLLPYLIELHLYKSEFKVARDYLAKYGNPIPKTERTRILVDIYDQEGEYEKAISLIKSLRETTGEPSLYINSEAYLYIKINNPELAKNLLRAHLEVINFDLSAEAEIVNYELASKMINGKYHKDRLMNLCRFTNRPSVKAAIYAILNNKEECYKNIELSLKRDKSTKFSLRTWPAFNDLRHDEQFRELIGG